jgi:dTDP-glucose 4,6-dehydratase
MIGQKYNIVGEQEIDVFNLAQRISAIIGTPLKYRMVDFHSSRPGHDMRYALDGRKLEEMGYYYPRSFDGSLTSTIEWTLANPRWLDV